MTKQLIKSVTKRDIAAKLSQPTLDNGFDSQMFWLRGVPRIEGEWIVLDVDECEVYVPTRSSFLYELLSLRQPYSHDDIIQFVSQHGLLRNGLVEWRKSRYSQIDLGDGCHVTPYPADYDPAEGHQIKEPISVWAVLIDQVFDTVEAYYYLRKALDDDVKAIEHLHALRKTNKVLHLAGQLGHEQKDRLSDYNLQAFYSRAIEQSVNLGLRSVSPRIRAGVNVFINEDGSDTLVNDIGDAGYLNVNRTPDSHYKPYGEPGVFFASAYTRWLISLAWLELSYVMTTGSVGFNKCLDCGRWCPVKKKYCSKQCENRLRKERSRANKATAKSPAPE